MEISEERYNKLIEAELHLNKIRSSIYGAKNIITEEAKDPETGDIVIVLDVGYEYLYQFDPVIVVEECYPNSPYNFKHWKYKEIHDEL